MRTRPLATTRRTPRGWASAGRAVCLGGLLATGLAAEPPAPPPVLEVPVGLPVQIDGLLAPGEWKDAASVTLAPGGISLRLKQHRGTLMLALSSDRPWPRGTHLLLLSAPDLPESNALAPAAVMLDYEPLDHTRPHLLVRAGGADAAPERAEGFVLRASLHGATTSLELAARLTALGLVGPAPGARRFCVALTRAVGEATATWPAGLDLGASPGTPPPDLLSSARWARLTGLAEADGPGAISKADWTALKDEDARLTEAGHLAHTQAFELLEEGGRKVEKEDARIQREVLDRFAFIAAREPLDRYDLLVKGQVLRLLNRFEEALATFESLAVVRDGDLKASAAYERARVLQSLERHEEEAEAWRAAAALAPPDGRDRYEGAAQRALAAVAGRDAEREARRALEADPTSPLVLLTTRRGAVLLCLHAAEAPQAVAHFLRLVEQPSKDGGRFYDGTLFHRVLGDAFAQGGDPRTRSDGCDADLSGPASTTIPVETNARHGLRRGALAFARGAKAENASQFFLVVSPQPGLERGGYTVFGHVLAGQGVVDRLERCDELVSARVLRGLASASEGVGGGASAGDAPPGR